VPLGVDKPRGTSTTDARTGEAGSPANGKNVRYEIGGGRHPCLGCDRAKEFYRRLGWRLDADRTIGDAFRLVQLTPPGSSWPARYSDYMVAEQAGTELPT
jgi:hypothetical protein